MVVHSEEEEATSVLSRDLSQHSGVLLSEPSLRPVLRHLHVITLVLAESQ